MPSWLPSRARWSLDPGVRLEDDERALRPIGPSAFFRFLRALPSFPPQKRGPRNRGGATPTGRTSAQRIFRQHDARVLLKQDSALRAAEAMAVRCPLGCHPELGGPWIPAFAGKTMRELSARLALRAFPIPPRSPFVSPAKAGAQEPRWCDTHWPDLSAADIPPARCSGSFETRQRAPCCGGHGGSMPSWLPSRARWPLDPGVRREDDERALRQIGPPPLPASDLLSLRFPRKSGGPGTAVVRHPLAGPQRSGYSASTMLGCS